MHFDIKHNLRWVFSQLKIDRLQRTMSSNEDEHTIRTLLPLEHKEHVYSNDRRSKYKALSDPNNNDSVKYDFNVYKVEARPARPRQRLAPCT